jgi:acylphosphatase
MKLTRKSAALALAKGQIWKLQDSHIEILEMGKRLASYKHFRTLDNRRAPTQLANIASVEEMLKNHKAVLLDTKAGSAAIKKVVKKK